MKYRLSGLAEEDLADIWAYVASQSDENRADHVLESVLRRILTLARQPRIGRLRPEFGDDVRSFPAGSYIIYYRVSGVLLVARVLHAHRDQEAAWDVPPS